MFCPNCGTNIPDGSKFCPKCGARTDEETAGRQTSAGPAQENQAPDSGSTGQQASQPAQEDRTAGSESGSGKKLTPRIIGIIIAAVVVIAIIVVLIVVLSNSGGGGGTAAVELDNYVDISAEGYNGYGTVSYTFDTTNFVNDYAEKVAYKSADGKGEPSASAAQSLADRVADTGTFSNSENLSNGDEITFSWGFDADAIENLYEVTLKYDDLPYTVEGLEELKEVDVIGGGELDGNTFDGITVEFSGTSPQGTASVDTANSFDGVTASMFTLSQSSWLANGDTITVSITDEGIEKLAESFGIVPTETEKEITVDGLPYYVADIDEIPEESFKTGWTRIEEERSKELEVWTTSESEFYMPSGNAGPCRKLNAMNYQGCYFFVNEETGSNTLIYIYQMDVVQNRGESGHGLLGGNYLDDYMTYYWFGYYSDLVVNEDGTCVIPSSYENPLDLIGDGASFTTTISYNWASVSTKDLTYTGYQYLDEMTQAIKNTLGEYTLVNDTVSEKEEEETEPEENNEGEEQAPEENNEGEGEAPEENNEEEQQEGD